MLLSLPVVPKHEVCPEVHESLISGASGEDASEPPEEDVEGGQSVGEPEQGTTKPNPFAALEALKKGGVGDKH